MTFVSARGASLLVQRDDDRYDSQTRSRNRFGLRRHPFVGPTAETRPTLLKEHRCAPLLVQCVPELRWMFAIPHLLLRA